MYKFHIFLRGKKWEKYGIIMSDQWNEVTDFQTMTKPFWWRRHSDSCLQLFHGFSSHIKGVVGLRRSMLWHKPANPNPGIAKISDSEFARWYLIPGGRNELH